MKRIALFLATNLAIVLVLSITMRLLGVEPYLNANGLNLKSLLIFAAVMGFGGSLISLMISKWTARMSVGAQVIETPRNADERWLIETVARQAQAAWAIASEGSEVTERVMEMVRALMDGAPLPGLAPAAPGGPAPSAPALAGPA